MQNSKLSSSLLRTCKYKIKKRKLVDFIDDELDLSSSDSI